MIELHGVLNIPAALHMCVGNCSNGCHYCYVCSDQKRQKPQMIEKAINISEDVGLRNYYLKNRYPISISNTGDIFSCGDHTIWDQLRILKEAGFPLYVETKGPHNKEDEETFFSIVNKKDITYLTMSNISRQDLEPYAPSFTQRYQFLKNCLARGLMVEIGLNPYIPSQATQEDTLAFIEDTGNKNVVYCLWPLHGVKTLHPFSAQVNHEARKEQKWPDVKPILAKLDELNIPYDGKYADRFFWGAESASHRMREYFGKKMLISDDIVSLAKQGYEEDKEDENEYIVGGITWKDFCNNVNIPDIVMKRSEIRVSPKYAAIEKKIPQQLEYKEYLKLGFYNPQGVKSVFSFSGLWYNEGEAYYWPWQHELVKLLGWGE